MKTLIVGVKPNLARNIVNVLTLIRISNDVVFPAGVVCKAWCVSCTTFGIIRRRCVLIL